MRYDLRLPIFSGGLRKGLRGRVYGITFLLVAATLSPVAITQTKPRSVRVFPGKLDSEDLPLSGARLCVAPKFSPCFVMPSMSPKGSKPGFYQFGLTPQWKLLHAPPGETLLLFSATFSGGGSGTLTRYAILREDGGKITNLLPDVVLTNASEEAIWKDPKLSAYPIFVTADFDWDMDAGETHFSQHRYFVRVWRFDQKRDLYAEAIAYRTSRKYDSLDDADTINVISPERPEILRRLQRLIP
jgi:hypothetical protein